MTITDKDLLDIHTAIMRTTNPGDAVLVASRAAATIVCRERGQVGDPTCLGQAERDIESFLAVPAVEAFVLPSSLPSTQAFLADANAETDKKIRLTLFDQADVEAYTQAVNMLGAMASAFGQDASDKAVSSALAHWDPNTLVFDPTKPFGFLQEMSDGVWLPPSLWDEWQKNSAGASPSMAASSLQSYLAAAPHVMGRLDMVAVLEASHILSTAALDRATDLAEAPVMPEEPADDPAVDPVGPPPTHAPDELTKKRGFSPWLLLGGAVAVSAFFFVGKRK